MAHFLPQVELRSIWKRSCNQSTWAQNCINSVWLGIFRRIKIQGESEEVPITNAVPNYTLFLHKFSGNFSHPLAIFPVDN
jgi:hypothetical protein